MANHIPRLSAGKGELCEASGPANRPVDVTRLFASDCSRAPSCRGLLAREAVAAAAAFDGGGQLDVLFHRQLLGPRGGRELMLGQ